MWTLVILPNAEVVIEMQQNVYLQTSAAILSSHNNDKLKEGSADTRHREEKKLTLIVYG